MAETAGGDAAQKLFGEPRRRGNPFFQGRVQHLCRKDRVNTNASRRPLGAEFAGHLDDGRHRHAVGDVPPPQSGDAGDRADVDDAASAGGEHPPTRFLACAEPTQHEVTPDLFHIFERDVFRRAEGGFSSDVAEEIDSAELAIQGAE